MRTRSKNFTLNQGRGDDRVIIAGGKFDFSELSKGNIFKQKEKWQLVLNVSKSTDMRIYFETRSIIKRKKDKGNRHVIRFVVVVVFFVFIYIYINYIIHCKIKRDNHQVPKIVRVPRNKINPKKIRLKIYK